jgi:hypothetical protein
MKRIIIAILCLSASLAEANVYTIKKVQNGDCDKIVNLTSQDLLLPEKLAMVLKLVELGNECALQYLFKMRINFNNNPEISEEFDIATGKSIIRNPKGFLKSIQEYNKTNKAKIGILCNLGDEFVDEFEKQSKELNKRIEAIQSVDDSQLATIKQKCLEVLNSCKKEIEGIEVK